jgi:S1-C subfamily serine protease
VAVDLERGPQAYYQTAFPVRDVSASLERALGAVVRIHAEGWYDHYLFAEESAPLSSHLETGALGTILASAIDTVRASTARAATAAIIAATDDRITLVTTDHAIDFPAMVVEHYGRQERGDPAEGRPVERIAMKVRQTSAVIGLDNVDPFEVLTRDEQLDLALLGVARVFADAPLLPLAPPPPRVPVLDPRVGDPRSLSWGSFVYVVGHPGGFRMVTRGIVSEPDRNPDGAFLIDGLWNEGMSGAPILAIRGDNGAFEWVGVAQAAAARMAYRFVPEEGAERTQDPRRPYLGPLYLQEVEEIRPGISFSIPVTTVRRFIDQSRPLLVELGYPVPSP